MKNDEIIKVSISVSVLADIENDATLILNGLNNKNELTSFLEKEYTQLKCELTYPFNGAIIFIENASSIADILQPIAKYYKTEVYANPEKYGVYGHGISDLCFERIVIRKNKVEIFIGS